MGTKYWDGQEDDGRIIRPPTDDESIVVQRQMISDMHKRPGVVFTDPWTQRPMTQQDMFDQHARLLLVIGEVEAREAKESRGQDAS